MKNRIYEHLKTKKKYETLQLKYDVKCEELENKIMQYNTEKRIRLKQMDTYEQTIRDLTERNIELNKKLVELKNKNKELRKEKADVGGTNRKTNKTR